MKNVFYLLILTISSYQSTAQDTLFYKSKSFEVVKIINETTADVEVCGFSDSTNFIYKVNKSTLEGIHYQNDSAIFASMSDKDFKKLSKIHLMEFGFSNSKLADNLAYTNGYDRAVRNASTRKTLIYIGICGIAVSLLYIPVMIAPLLP